MKNFKLFCLLLLGGLMHCLPINSMQRDLKTRLEFAFFAIENDNLTVLKILYNKNNAIIHATEKNRITALHAAARYGAVQCAEFLLANGVKKDAPSNQNATALIIAIAFSESATA